MMYALIVLSCCFALVFGSQVHWKKNENVTDVNDTCRTNGDPCTNSTSPSESISSDEVWTNNCFCDVDCWKYGDCCFQTALTFKNQFESPPQLKHWGCEMTAPVTGTDHVYMITSCPFTWPDDEVKKKCNRDENQISGYTYELDYPVVSRTTHVIYVNIYCAICHRDTQLENMEAKVECNVPQGQCLRELVNATYRPTLREWGTVGFTAYFHLPQLLAESQFRLQRRIRMCRPTVNLCKPTWNNESDIENCALFADYVRKENDPFTIYKNRFCAACNNIDSINTLTCDLPPPPLGPEVFEVKGSFSLILDFSDREGGGQVGTIRRCQKGQVFDPLHDVCVELPCGRLFDKVNGECKPKPSAVIDGSNTTSLNDSCPKLIRPVSSFKLFRNGSIVLISSGQVFHMGQYEYQDDEEILICSRNEHQYASKFSAMQSTLSSVVLLVSVFCLSFHIAIHGSFSKLRNLPGKNLLSLSVMLLCGQVLFFGVTRIRPGGFCEFIAVMMHFCFLSSFFWMNVMAVDICRTFTVLKSNSSSSDKNYRRYATYAWGFSGLIVGSSIIVDNSNLFPTLRPNYGNAMCWISQRKGLLVFFAVPLAILLIENIVFFVLTARGICRTTEAARSIKKTKETIRFVLYIKLALIMGFTWVIGFVAALGDLDVLWYGFIVLNGLQGTFIFLAFSLKKKVFVLIKAKYFTRKSKQSKNGNAGGPRGLNKSAATSMTNLNTTCTRISSSNLNVHAV